MQKRGQYLLILGSAFVLTASVAGGLTAGVLRYNQTQRWKINPYENYDFEQAKNSLLNAKIPPELVNDYIELVKKITGVSKTNEIIKASKLLNLNNQMMNSISQRMIWNHEDVSQIQKAINLAKPILMQFYEYYDHVYIYQNDLINDSLNQMQLKSANTDLYKWSIGTNISDYSYIKDYLESAKEAWITKMKMSYIFETFLSKKMSLYNSLIDQANVAITEVRKEIQKLIEDKNELLNAKSDAEDHLVSVSNFLSAVKNWEIAIHILFGLTEAATFAQILAMGWMPLLGLALGWVTLGLGLAYSTTEIVANIDLKQQTHWMADWFSKIGELTWLKDLCSTVNASIELAYTRALIVESGIRAAVWALATMVLLAVDWSFQYDMFQTAKTKIGNSDSEVSKAIKDYIKSLDQQISDNSEKIDSLNKKETNYMNQKVLFNTKLNELSNYNKFFKNFNQMNDNTFTQSYIFTADQINKWQKEEVEVEYGYLTENSTVTSDFIEAFVKEKNNYSKNYFDLNVKRNDFINNYNNNDKEYFLKNLLIYIDSPLKNYDTYFNKLDFNWNNYDDIFEKFGLNSEKLLSF